MTSASQPHTGNPWMKNLVAVILLSSFFLSSCQPTQAQDQEVAVSIEVDRNVQSVIMPAGSTIQQAIEKKGISLSTSDRVNPPVYTILTNGMVIVITRIREEFETQQITLPYTRLELRNESLTSGETRLIQAGQNGLEEVTIRHIFENNIEGGSSVVTENIIQEPIPEIIMIGVQSPFSPISIPGKLAFLTGGNAWIMDGNTANRWPLITSGDLDDRIFNLSPDGKWLLFSRKSTKPNNQEINTLWVVSTDHQASSAIELGIVNVVHFADWQPGQRYIIAYSTVEPSATAPGWDANNDLHFLRFIDGKPGEDREILDTNYGGIYPWWGMTFAWSVDGESLAFSRPDAVGTVDISGSKLNTPINITPLNTHGDWAWTPNIAWSNDGHALFFTSHAKPGGLVAPEDSPNFDLSSISIGDEEINSIIPGTGMFSYPAPSPLFSSPTDGSQMLAYMQAIFPSQSSISRYKLVVSDMDGTNSKVLFPIEGQSGLEPQNPIWSPEETENGNKYIAIIYEGNLWIVDEESGLSQQVTGDGLTKHIDWK
jgi:resuscitation-promoting factor RpfB